MASMSAESQQRQQPITRSLSAGKQSASASGQTETLPFEQTDALPNFPRERARSVVKYIVAEVRAVEVDLTPT